MRFIRSSVIVAFVAIALALAGCTSEGDTADAPRETPSSAAPTASTASVLPEGIYPENYGCTEDIVAAVEGATYTEPGCYYAPLSMAVSFVTECGFETTFENGGAVTRIKSCVTTHSDCTEVQEFGPNGEYLPQQGPNGFFVVLDEAGCYDLPGHLSAEAGNECTLTEVAAPDGYRRYELAC